MFQPNRIAAALLLVGSLTGAAACSREASRADEALLIPPGTTSGGTAMNTVEPAAQARYSMRSISLGAIDAPSSGDGAANASAAPANAPGTTITIGSSWSPYRTTGYSTSGYPGAPINNGAALNTVGTVNGDYGPMPSSGDAIPTSSYGTPGGVITH